RACCRAGAKPPLRWGTGRRPPWCAQCSGSDRGELGTVTADGGQLQGREDEVELTDGSAAHKSHGTVRAFPQPCQRVAQRVRHENLAGRRGEVEDRSVDVEQDRKLVKRSRERRSGLYRDVCAASGAIQFDPAAGNRKAQALGSDMTAPKPLTV